MRSLPKLRLNILQDRSSIVVKPSANRYIREKDTVCTQKRSQTYILIYRIINFVAITLNTGFMKPMTVKDFRTNLSAVLDKVDTGERILVRRHNKVYTIIPVENDDLTITPELQAKIDKARQEYKDGKTTNIRTHEELDAFIDSL